MHPLNLLAGKNRMLCLVSTTYMCVNLIKQFYAVVFKTDYNTLIFGSFQKIQKNTYKEQLEDGGVHIIPKDHISLQSKIALGKPYSGDVYNAQWTQDDNTKVVCEGIFSLFLYHTFT